MTFQRRHLPHLFATGRAVFLTWRLHGSLPPNRAFPASTVSSGEAFAAVDRLLDEARTGPFYLRQPEIADMVVEAMHYSADGLQHYDLHAFVVMANHVHILIAPHIPLPTLTKSLKGITARRANALVGSTGAAFWQEESYDRLVRNEPEFEKIGNYIEHNPVRAGLVSDATEYWCSSAGWPTWGSATFVDCARYFRKNPMPLPVQVEYEGQRIKIRTFNKKIYRVSHWPIWIWVFFLAPGPLTFDLFAHGFSRGNLTWLICVLIGTGIAGIRGQLPGVEPAPYILRFTEDRPNPFYRRICYTFAWSDVVTFASLNLAGLAYAAVTGLWRMKQIYDYGYFPVYGTILALGAFGILPRVRPSTKGEGTERRYFYGSVWAVTFAQTLELILWKLIPPGRSADFLKFGAYTAALVAVGICAMMGLLPRTRPIVPGETIIGD